jgi:hydrogenase maturation protein HypF
VKNAKAKSLEIHIFGLVQGVGFRPFIYRLALRNGIHGWVKNTNECVVVLAQAGDSVLDDFIKAIREEAPPASMIENIKVQEVHGTVFNDFSILSSSDHSEHITGISPDIAVCQDCLSDMRKQPNRIRYPFINCTNCGPRFSIIQSLPYDRERTTMKPFSMCSSCRREYSDIVDRRFHAQPVACRDCGPAYMLREKEAAITQIDDILARTASLIDSGKIIAVKGMGGYHLACNALDPGAVERLRMSKLRESKPFAVMFRDLQSLGTYCIINEAEKTSLLSWRRPILLLRSRTLLAPGVSNGLATIGAMLPYMPFHYLLFEQLQTPVIVLTSGNLSDEPIVIDDEQAERVLGPITDAVLSYNREIFNRTDDSVMMAVNKKPRLIRRSRGFVPNPVRLDIEVEGVLATGAELVNCFCIGKGKQAIMSQHIGDLKNLETLEFYEETYGRFRQLFRFEPKLVACDLHPDYLSTRFAREQGIELFPVQHHHAHIASVLAEHRINRKVIGISFDGTGYGVDGNIWGGEILLCDLAGFERKGHLRYIPVPGGDKVSEEPWRMGVSYLYDTFGKEFFQLQLPFLSGIGEKNIRLLVEAIDRKVNCPLSSGAGRLFDAVSAITGICVLAGFHAEAPMRLENAIEMGVNDHYPFRAGTEMDFRPMIMALVEDVRKNVRPGIIAARFHNTILEAIFREIQQVSLQAGIREAAFSGGTFQNRYLVERLEQWLEKEEIPYYTNLAVPCNDGGIALGQLAVAAMGKKEG